MFADSRNDPMDLRVIEDMDSGAFHPDSLRQYRQNYLHETHPWNQLPDDEFLLRLKASGKNSKGGLSPTAAGLLMFGEAWRITEEFPGYFLDYREQSQQEGVPWLFRITSDEGDRSGNLHDFFFRIVNQLDDEIAVPFVNRVDGFRISDTSRTPRAQGGCGQCPYPRRLQDELRDCDTEERQQHINRESKGSPH